MTHAPFRAPDTQAKGSKKGSKSSGPASASPESAAASKKGKGASSGGKGSRGPQMSFPPAEELVKGSRVRRLNACFLHTSARLHQLHGACMMCSQCEHNWDRMQYEAIVVGIGSRDKSGQMRLQWVTSPGADADESAAKEWKPAEEIRPVPPPSPPGWLKRLRAYDVISAQLPDGDGGWCEVPCLGAPPLTSPGSMRMHLGPITATGTGARVHGHA